jgi:hypothetical protein
LEPIKAEHVAIGIQRMTDQRENMREDSLFALMLDKDNESIATLDE